MLDKFRDLGFSPDVEKKIKLLVSLHIKYSQVVSGIIIGSVAKNMFDQNRSDIDLLFLIHKEDNMEAIDGELTEHDIISIKNNGIYSIVGNHPTVSYSYMDLSDFSMLMDTTIGIKTSPSIEPWLIGGNIQDVLLADLEKSIILFDKTETVEVLVQELKLHKDKILRELNERLLGELKQKMKLCTSAIRNNNCLLFVIGFGEILVLLERIYCAEHRLFNPGLKHVIGHQSFSSFFDEYKLDLLMNSNFTYLDMVNYVRTLENLLIK